MEEIRNRLFSLSQDLICIASMDGYFKYVNPAWEQLLGYSTEELLSKPFLDFIHPEDQPKKDNEVTRLSSGLKTVNFENRYICKDHSICHIQWMASPLPEEGLIYCIGRDITEKKQMGKNIKEQNEFLKTVLDSLEYPFYIIDPNNFTIKLANKAFGPYKVGYTTCHEKTHGSSQPCNEKDHLCPVKQVTLTQKHFRTEHIHYTPEGKACFIQVNAYPIFDKEKNIVNIIEYAVDISDRKHYELQLKNAKEKAEESDRLKSAFLANMSHEIRTPMNHIVGFSDLLAETMLNDKQKRYTHNIRSSSAMLLELLDDIIDYSKIEVNQIETKQSKCNLQEMFLEMSDINTEYLIKNNPNIEFLVHFSEQNHSSLITTDPFRLKQILTNLLSNAIKFTNAGTIETGCILRNPNFLEFCVKDTGIGIPSNMQDKIFERFQQVDFDSSRSYEGMGLGLAISKGLVELLGGEIGVESEPGIGSRFYFTIPYKPISNPNEIQQKSPSLKDYDGKNKTILVVEDDEISTVLFKDILTSANFRVHHTSSGEEAIKCLKLHDDIAAVCMDIKLPGIDGFVSSISL